MSTVKRITDLSNYTTVLPYASEMFGVYQPLLGWRSKRIQDRFKKGFDRDKVQMIDRIKNLFIGLSKVKTSERGTKEVEMRIGEANKGMLRSFDSVVMQQIASKLPESAEVNPEQWRSIINEDHLQAVLDKEVSPLYKSAIEEWAGSQKTGMSAMKMMRMDQPVAASSAEIQADAIEVQMQYESSLAGALKYLVDHKAHHVLEEIFYEKVNYKEKADQLIKMLAARNSAEAYLGLDTLNPQQKGELDNVLLSPISVVHLFRQYFYELDTFLGTPVGHVWLSPGSSVELLEVHTRTERVEKTLENVLDIMSRSELSTTTQDEISEAVKESNRQDIKVGASVTASYASISATSSFDFSNSQERSREAAHKRMRQQTEKLSSEIRKSFKSTFKTVTETTDVSSTKHVMANTTNELVNYEMRRKMRQVGVQVQDIGTYLCWQTYVDDPGSDLGLSKLIHIAKSPDLDGIPHPEEIPALQPFVESKMVTIPFISVSNNADNEGEVYAHGVEVDNSEFMGKLEKIKADFDQEFVCPQSDFVLSNVEFDAQGKPISVSRSGEIVQNGARATFKLHLDSVDFQGQNSIQINVILHWSPTVEANNKIQEKNAANRANFKAKEKVAYEKAFIDTVKERVELASKIVTRNTEDLREEEKIVVYRKLIHELLLKGVSLPDDRSRHVVAELLNSIFDIDKMLYFVAPEWWRPRMHRSRQQLQPTRLPPPRVRGIIADQVGSAANVAIKKGLSLSMQRLDTSGVSQAMAPHTVGWGGVNDNLRDNYYITEDSEPAKLGSSLGWLLQLDGDNMRNAFLNAPWVKAVIPIRPGKEKAALNWLKGVEGMNGITDDVIYRSENPDEKDINGNPLDGQKMINVLMDLAEKIQKKHKEGVELGKYPKPGEVIDPQLVDEENTVTSTPIDRVYEHGFFPLENSFKANVDGHYEIFDQWIEILPTDQVVPVEVKYDPRTGRQIVDPA